PPPRNGSLSGNLFLLLFRELIGSRLSALSWAASQVHVFNQPAVPLFCRFTVSCLRPRRSLAGIPAHQGATRRSQPSPGRHHQGTRARRGCERADREGAQVRGSHLPPRGFIVRPMLPAPELTEILANLRRMGVDMKKLLLYQIPLIRTRGPIGAVRWT